MTSLAILPNEKPAATLRPMLRPTDFRHWQNELDHFEQEVKFFRQLVRMGVTNGSQHSKPALFHLLDELSGMQENDLAELRNELAVLAENKHGERQSGLPFFQKMERRSAALRKLKTQVFAHANELHKITIW
jgi:hypothetical protein